MNIPTFSAIQTIKYHLRSESKSSVAYFAKKNLLHERFEKKLVENLRSSCRAYRDEKYKKMEQKQKQMSYSREKKNSCQKKQPKSCVQMQQKSRE